MNNYLTNIVARTLNIAPTVRPRLRGRFDPLPAGREPVGPSIFDRTVPSDSNRRTETEKSRPPRESEDRYSARESTSRDHARDRQPVNTRDDSHEPDQATLPPEETHAVQAMTLERNTSPTSTIRVDAGEIAHLDLPPAREDRLSPIVQPAHSTSSSGEKALPVSAKRPDRSAESWTLKPSSREFHDGNVNEPQPRYLPTALERGLEATFEGDAPLPAASLRDPEPVPRPRNTVEPEHQIDNVPATQHHLVVPPRIAPRVEIGPERFLLNRQPSPQPPPTIHVTIGRVEVRATRTAQPSRSTSKDPAQPVMKLDEYLRGRSQGNPR